ncbi:MAG: metallophosphoesterase family protein [Chloroflexi bacterium]|nr:metallophosphoesterase family protein [Chloroflexota bacterium]
MRIALFSDVHSNLPALEAVLRDIKTRGADGVYCLGDLVGYAPFPNEVIDVIRREGIPTILGNYDDGVGFDRDECGCAYRKPEEKRLGEISFQWTKAHVTPENKGFLRGLHGELRLEVDGKRILLVHGSPRRINEYLFEDRPLSSFRRLAASAQADVVVYGHTHRPYVKTADGVLFVNVGSTGKPKDGDPRACYALLEVQAGKVDVNFQRVPYDLTAVASAIRKSGLPFQFAEQIERGGGLA